MFYSFCRKTSFDVKVHFCDFDEKISFGEKVYFYEKITILAILWFWRKNAICCFDEKMHFCGFFSFFIFHE